MTHQRLHALALGVTLVVHGGLVGAVAATHALDRTRESGKLLREPPHIEAGLAIRAKSSKGRRSRLPQKNRVAPVKPDALAVARDPNRVPTTDPKPDPTPPADLVDPAATFEKFRKAGEAGVVAGGEGSDGETQEGAAEGSDFGTLAEAKGDPYVGELVGRMTANPEMVVPSVVTETGLETWGCVKLAPSGKIAERVLEEGHTSKNRVFNRAVEERLKITTDMESPVPDHLRDLLIERGICVPYRY